MDIARVVAVVALFVWLGMVVAISFLEAPLKFRAPGVTLQTGVGIGRLVFRALNYCEAALAVVVLATFPISEPPSVTAIALAVALVTLGIQFRLARTRLGRRSEAVLAGEAGPRSRAHWVYVGLEVVKAIAILTAGVFLLLA